MENVSIYVSIYICVQKKKERIKIELLTTRTKRVLMKKRKYPNRFLFLVLIFDSLYVNIANVPSANGSYTRVSTLEGW